MKKALMAFALGAVFVSAARAAEPRYDQSLEDAATRIAAAKVGDIRGGFSFRDKPQFVAAQSAPPPVAHADPDAAHDDGLVPAVEGPSFRLVN